MQERLSRLLRVEVAQREKRSDCREGCSIDEVVKRLLLRLLLLLLCCCL